MSVEWDCSQEEDVHLNAGWGRTWTEEESLTLEQSERKWEVERGRMQQELLEWERQREINGSRDEDVDSEVLQGISSDLRRLGLLPSTSQGGENGEVIDKEVEQDRTIKFQEESQTSPPAGHVAERLHEAPAMRQPSLSDPVNMSSQDCVRNAQPSRPVLAAGGSVQQCLPGIQNISPLAEVQRSRVAGVGMVVEHSGQLWMLGMRGLIISSLMQNPSPMQLRQVHKLTIVLVSVWPSNSSLLLRHFENCVDASFALVLPGSAQP
jgi:hypothetical protein